MRTTTQTFKRIMASGGARKYLVNIDLTLADTTVLHLTEADIWDNTFKIETASSGTSSFDIGSAVIGKCSFSINNFDERFNQYDFFNASAVVWVGLVGDIDNNDTQVYYRMGFYTVDEPVYASSLITLELLDNMWKFDIPLSAVTLTYPITIRNAFVAICQYCGVTLGTQTFHGDSFTIEAAPEKDMNCREFLQYMAMIGCNFLTISDTGALLVKWYNTSAIPSGTDIDGGTFDTNTTPYSDGDNLNGGTFAFNDGDTADGGTFTDNSDCVWFTRNMQATFGTDVITITGVKFTINDTAYTIGTAGYMLELENPIVNANNVNTVLNLIWDVLNGFSLRTYNITTISDLSAEVGDCCILKDYKGNFFYSWITLNSFGFSNHVVQCNAVTPQRQLAKRYSKTISAAVEATRKQTEEIISDYDLAVQLMNDIVVNAMGGYEDYEDLPTGGRVYYLSNMPITKSASGTCSFQSGSTVFKRTGDGLFVSTNGGQTWQNGYNAQTGQLIVNVLNAIGVSAEWIKTGTLTVGGSGVGNPSIVVKDSNNNPVVDINQNGLTAHAGVIRTADNTFYVDMASNSVRIGAGTGIYDPNSKYSGTYVPTNNNYPASSWTDAEKANHIGETFTNTSSKKTYIYKAVGGTLPESEHNPYSDNVNDYYHFTIDSSISTPVLHFNSQCATEGSNYDYVDLYKAVSSGAGTTYQKIRLQGNTSAFGAKNIAVPSEFWLHWHTDTSQHNYYGYKIDSINSSGGDSVSWEAGTLPSATWTDISYPSGSYEWVESTITEYIDVKASSDVDLTQEEVYNILTNNGQTQGLFLQNGKIYLNGQYFTANAITIGGSNYSQKPYLQVLNSSNDETVKLDINGMKAIAGQFGNMFINTTKKNNQTYSYLTYGGNASYIKQEWDQYSSTVINASNNSGSFIFVPYVEGWTESDTLDCQFELSFESYPPTTAKEKATQCTIKITQYNENGKMSNASSGGVQYQGSKTFWLNYEGWQKTSDSGSVTDVYGMEGYQINKDWGKNAGEFYQVEWEVAIRDNSYASDITLEISDNGNGYSFYLGSDLGSDNPEDVRCLGKFQGYFTGNASLTALDLGKWIYTPYESAWKAYSIKSNSAQSRFALLTPGGLTFTNDQGTIDGSSSSSAKWVGIRYNTIQKASGSSGYQVVWESTSDERVKKNIQPLPTELSKQLIDGTQPKSFEFIDPDEKGKRYGMIAQEARKLLDSLGETDAHLEYITDAPSGFMNLRCIHYEEYIPHLINYVKDLRSEIDSLKAEIKELKGE